jgi:hypothetical protein
LHPATVAALDQAGLLDAAARQALAAVAHPSLRNFRGIVTGDARAIVVLDKIDRPLGRAGRPQGQ